MTKKTIDAAFVEGLVDMHGEGTAWSYIADVIAFVIYEVQALGPHAILQLGKIGAKLKLDDKEWYKIKYEHSLHAIALYRMVGTKHTTCVATFANGTTQAQVWAALHPWATAKVKAKTMVAHAEATV
jgi:hypothetical protein